MFFRASGIVVLHRVHPGTHARAKQVEKGFSSVVLAKGCRSAPALNSSSTRHRRSDFRRQDDGVKHCQVVADASCHYEQVPNGVAIWNLSRGEEHHTDRVHNASRNQPSKSESRDMGHERSGGHHYEPAHREIEDRGEDLEMVYKPELEDDPSHGAAPDDSKQRPSPSAPQIDEQKRRVGSRNQQIDRRVIQDSQRTL